MPLHFVGAEIERFAVPKTHNKKRTVVAKSGDLTIESLSSQPGDFDRSPTCSLITEPTNALVAR